MRQCRSTLRLMTTNNITIGIDLGDRKHSACVLSAAGETHKGAKKPGGLTEREDVCHWFHRRGGVVCQHVLLSIQQIR